MNCAVITQRAGAGQAATAGPGTQESLHAEWTKLRTVPGTIWLLLAVVALTLGLGAVADAAARCPSASCHLDPARISLTGIYLSQAIVAILAVVAIGGEYSSGMIRVTFTAMPHRATVLAAKAVAVTGLVLAAGTIAVLGSLLAGGGSSCPAMASPRRTATRHCRWATGRSCAPPPGRFSTSP